ncbi:GNAT family N-acetyltransferase [Ovoidimarina sediminis]|uniref:GNAT family N-acetyltransferase n=1 Tax=Ovoidimarina sediminis TaxID=3079856 RepID=UPI00291356FB|nr:GNAT family N-acetyltransferase [Rhodophyticola sp. MJ-SS7]MDU8944931.1 GNAT family N-acetyltransferase [Rhodophyticola sp. MJ-SS7]
MTASVFTASPSEMQAIAAVMDKGFQDDPTVRWAAATQEDFEALHHRFVEICARPAFAVGGVHVLEGCKGAAVWYPPGVALDVGALEAIFATASRQDRIGAFFDLLEACEPFRPKHDYWELELLAVDPACQGQGLGAALLAHGLGICDRAGQPVYLESSNPANLSIYRRHGFECLAEVQLPGTPKRFPMLRAARG